MAINEQTYVEKAISAQNTFSDTLKVNGCKIMNISVYSTALSANIRVQRRRPGSSTWHTLATYTANAEKILKSAGNWEYRIGVPTGDFTSATGLVVGLSF